MTNQEKQSILALIRQEVVPAIGCTEPMAVALCVAKATQLLGVVPERIELRLSANILKNAMGVGIPGTGMIGLPIAVALGALIGRPEKGLEVLCDCSREAVERGKKYIAENRIDIQLEKDDPDKLYINALVKAGDRQAEARIKHSHTHFVIPAEEQGWTDGCPAELARPAGPLGGASDASAHNGDGTLEISNKELPGKKLADPQPTQAIEKTMVTEKAHKVIIDGQLRIVRGDKVYDATGREL